MLRGRRYSRSRQRLKGCVTSNNVRLRGHQHKPLKWLKPVMTWQEYKGWVEAVEAKVIHMQERVSHWFYWLVFASLIHASFIGAKLW